MMMALGIFGLVVVGFILGFIFGYDAAERDRLNALESQRNDQLRRPTPTAGDTL